MDTYLLIVIANNAALLHAFESVAMNRSALYPEQSIQVTSLACREQCLVRLSESVI